MTLSTVVSDARTLANTDSTGLSNSDALVLANEALFDLRSELIKRDIDAGTIQEAYMTALTGTAVYMWPTDQWILKELEVNYVDTQQKNYKPANPYDAGNLPQGISLDYLRTAQSKAEPLFDNRGNSFEIIPGPTGTDNVTNFFRILYFLAPTSYTDGTNLTDTIQYPENLDYRLLSFRIAYLHSLRVGQTELANSLLQQYMNRLEKIINILSPGQQQQPQALGLQITGWEF